MTDEQKSTHDEIADDAEAQADDLERKGDEVSEQIADTKKDWDAKRADTAVPGANPPELEEPGG